MNEFAVARESGLRFSCGMVEREKFTSWKLFSEWLRRHVLLLLKIYVRSAICSATQIAESKVHRIERGKSPSTVDMKFMLMMMTA